MLVVEIVEAGCVRGEQVPRAEGEIVAAVVHDDFDGPQRREEGGLVRREAGCCETYRESEHVDDDRFDRVVVKRAVRVRDIDLFPP